MVHVSTPRPSIGAAFGQGLAQGIPQAGQRIQLSNALQQVRGLANQSNVSPFDLAATLMQATAGIPGAEKYVGQLYPLLLQEIQSRQGANLPAAGDVGQPRLMQESFQPTPEGSFSKLPIEFGQMGKFQKVQTPSQQVSEQTPQFFPNILGPQEASGNIPQEATGGQKRPILSTPEQNTEARRIVNERRELGIPITFPEALKEVKEANEENKAFNREVEEERKNRIDAQKKYGDFAASKLKQVHPNATPEQEAIFKKIGENVASEGKSEADIERTIAKEATKFANTISNIRSDLSAPRTHNQLHRKFLGNQKEFDSAANDLKVKIKPLLDLGLYDTARNLLSELGYYPEERESVINPLSEKVKTSLNLVPQAKKITQKAKAGIGLAVPLGNLEPQVIAPNQITNVLEGIKDAFDKDGNVSLVLLRRGFEDKGYDWRTFKDSLNSLIQNQEIELNGDQTDQLKYLDQPPLNALEKILHGLNLIGR